MTSPREIADHFTPGGTLLAPLGWPLGPAADGDDGDGQGGRFAPETSVTAVTASRYGRFRAPQAKNFAILKRFQRNFVDFERIPTPRISQHFTTLHNI